MNNQDCKENMILRTMSLESVRLIIRQRKELAFYSNVACIASGTIYLTLPRQLLSVYKYSTATMALATTLFSYLRNLAVPKFNIRNNHGQSKSILPTFSHPMTVTKLSAHSLKQHLITLAVKFPLFSFCNLHKHQTNITKTASSSEAF